MPKLSRMERKLISQAMMNDQLKSYFATEKGRGPRGARLSKYLKEEQALDSLLEKGMVYRLDRRSWEETVGRYRAYGHQYIYQLNLDWFDISLRSSPVVGFRSLPW
jgi:hypothetical protein